MKKSIVLVLFFWLQLNFIFGQSQEVADWREFSPAYEEFQVETPKRLKNNISKFKIKKNEVYFSGNYLEVFNDKYFFIFSDSNSGKPYSFTYEKTDDFKNAVSQNAQFGKYNGKKYFISDQEGFFHQILKIEIKQRIYFFHLVSTEKNPEEFERFFATLKFFKTSIPKDTDFETKETKNEIVSQENTFDRELNGNQKDSLPMFLPIAQRESGKTTLFQNTNSPLKILSISKAPYTDLARNYNLSGSIKLRIMFLSDGTIGKIETIKKLPFGLTLNALESAKNIKFSPAISNGVPINVSKIIEYRMIIL